MLDVKGFSERLQRSLQDVLETPKVTAIEGDRFMMLGFVISPTFEGMDEGERQRIVWDRALRTFDPDEQVRIEFIYTDAPSEIEASAEPEPTVTNPGA